MLLRTILLSVVTLAVSTASQAAIVANGGFESGDFSNWTLTGNTYSNAEQVCASGTVLNGALCVTNSGNFAAALGPGGSPADLIQNVTTTKGSSYDLTFFLANDNVGSAPSNKFDVNFGGQEVYALTNLPTSGYKEYFVNDLVATSDSTSLDFLLQNDPGGFFLDDVALTPAADNPVPEPSCLLLVALAFGTFGFVRIQRCKKATN